MDINNFGPFDAAVWGTVTDVIITAVTIITAVYLYKTFKSQIAVQKMQQSLTEIENERYRIEHKPIFEIVPSEIKEIGKKEQDSKSLVSFKLKLIKNDAKDIEVSPRSGTANIDQISLGKNHIGITMPVSNIYTPDEFDLHFHVSTLSVLYDSEGGYFFFHLNFRDTLGNTYIQEFAVTFHQTTFINFSFRHPDRADLQ